MWLSQKISEQTLKQFIDDDFIRAINEKPESSWLVYMLSGDILLDG